MKTARFFSVLAVLVFSGFLLKAQDIPKPSPLVILSQTVGLTEIKIEYSSPAVSGRKIWDGLVPYGELWRTGANMATKITFSKDVTISNQRISAGTYSLFTIPGKTEWTVILNKDAELSGTSGYKEANDALRFKVKPQEGQMRERLLFLIADFTMDEAVIALEWEKIRIPFTVKLDTEKQAMESIQKTLAQEWRPFANSARYILEYGSDLDLALSYINTSISISDEWFNNWIKAQILAKKGDKKEALKLAQRAKELGDKSPGFFYKSQVEKALEDWKKK